MVINGATVQSAVPTVTVNPAASPVRCGVLVAVLVDVMAVRVGVVMVILFRLLLVFLVILCALPLAVFGAFVALALTVRALDLSALIGLLMPSSIVVTNAIVLLDLMQHKVEAGDDVRTALIQGGRTHVRPILMTAAATILALIPLALSSGGLIAAGLATVVIGGLTSSTLLPLVVIPVIYSLLVGLQRGGAGSGGLEAPATGSGVLQS